MSSGSEYFSVDDSQVKAMLQKLNARMKNLAPLYSMIGKQTIPYVERNFDKLVNERGVAWKQPAPATLAARAKGKGKNMFGPIPLSDRGNLRKINDKVENDGVLVGSAMIYGRTHDKGDSSRNIPRRQWAFFTIDAKARIQQVMNWYFDPKRG